MQEDYRLLCSRGCEPLDAYAKCNLGEAPSRALVGRTDWKTSPVGQDVIKLFNGNENLLEKREFTYRFCSMTWGGCGHQFLLYGLGWMWASTLLYDLGWMWAPDGNRLSSSRCMLVAVMHK